jgi:hypothetical protein
MRARRSGDQMESQTDHDTLIILAVQGQQIADLLAKHDEAIDSLIKSRIQYHATAAAYATLMPVLIKLFWK